MVAFLLFIYSDSSFQHIIGKTHAARQRAREAPALPRRIQQLIRKTSRRAAAPRPLCRSFQQFIRKSSARAPRTAFSEDGSAATKQKASNALHSRLKGATRNRTGDKGFADLCLTAWLWRHQHKYYITPAAPCQYKNENSFARRTNLANWRIHEISEASAV